MMSFTPLLVPDRDSLPLKKRDQRLSSPPQQQQQQQQQQQEGGAELATFKAPYPYRGRAHEFKTKPTSPFQPVPRRVPALYQPWLQIQSSRPRPHALSAFREHQAWAEWRGLPPLQPAGWDLTHQYQWPLPGTRGLHPSGFSPVVSDRLGRPGYEWERLKTLRYKASNPERQSNGREKGPYGGGGRRRDRKAEGTASPRPVSSSYESPKEDAGARASTEHQGLPWLLPHFGAGSLIELRDGRLRRVEHLQTEDFLLGSLACPDLRLSCCTVQSITSSTSSTSSSSSSSSSSTTSRLLILLHDLQTQELVDVYVEYPFFVRGRGWSSCSPQRTARLCGLQCRQLSVGDVCLALTPVSSSWPAGSLKPKTSYGGSSSSSSEKESEALQVPEGKRKTEVGRRRHCSAPELRGPGTNCM